MAPIFKALSITERHQKTPLTFLDYDEPQLKDDEILVENVAVAQVRCIFVHPLVASLNILEEPV